MADHDDLSYQQGLVVWSVGHRGVARAWTLSLAAVCLVVASASVALAADAPPQPDHPIWTLVPTHIDRDKEQHIRLPPETEAADHVVLSIDRPIRLGSDTTFLASGQPTRIFGIRLPERQKLCETPGNRRWACGVRAHAALTALLAARVLDCTRVSPLGTTVTLVSCTIGNTDIAGRLISEGWAEAEPAAGVALTSLQEAAQKAHRGIWRLTPPDM